MRTIVLSLAILLMASCKSPEVKTGSKTEGTAGAAAEKVTRYGWVIQVKADKLEEYKYLHAHPWPGVDSMLKVCYIRNYSIYYRDGLLFSYLEYTGDDFEADMALMAADSLTREWWKLTDPCQAPVASAEEGVWWADMEEVYHLD